MQPAGSRSPDFQREPGCLPQYPATTFVWNLDIRFVKDFALPGEGHHLDLFVDVFNVAAARNLNFGQEGVSFFGTPAAPVSTGGQPLYAPDTNHFGGARQVQFTARIVAF
jgi:hypothetical protein